MVSMLCVVGRSLVVSMLRAIGIVVSGLYVVWEISCGVLLNGLLW